jgi:hypothetical protein
MQCAAKSPGNSQRAVERCGLLSPGDERARIAPGPVSFRIESSSKRHANIVTHPRLQPADFWVDLPFIPSRHVPVLALLAAHADDSASDSGIDAEVDGHRHFPFWSASCSMAHGCYIIDAICWLLDTCLWRICVFKHSFRMLRGGLATSAAADGKIALADNRRRSGFRVGNGSTSGSDRAS